MHGQKTTAMARRPKSIDLSQDAPSSPTKLQPEVTYTPNALFLAVGAGMPEAQNIRTIQRGKWCRDSCPTNHAANPGRGPGLTCTDDAAGCFPVPCKAAALAPMVHGGGSE